MDESKFLEIYNRQHYFIERHDGMAEKMLNILAVIVAIVSAMISFNTDKPGEYFWIVLILLIIHLIFFAISLFFFCIGYSSFIKQSKKDARQYAGCSSEQKAD